MGVDTVGVYPVRAWKHKGTSWVEFSDGKFNGQGYWDIETIKQSDAPEPFDWWPKEEQREIEECLGRKPDWVNPDYHSQPSVTANRCTCGSLKTYGPGCSHSDWCDWKGEIK